MTRKSIGLCLAGALLVWVYLCEQVQATRLGYDVSRAHGELRRQRDRIAYLRNEYRRLLAPDRVAEAASGKFGMAPSTPESLVFLESPVARIAPASQAEARPTFTGPERAAQDELSGAALAKASLPASAGAAR